MAPLIMTRLATNFGNLTEVHRAAILGNLGYDAPALRSCKNSVLPKVLAAWGGQSGRDHDVPNSSKC